jgi:hypothetical protein
MGLRPIWVHTARYSIGGYAEGPLSLPRYKDLTSKWPGGSRFATQGETNSVPQESKSTTMRAAGLGEPGFSCIEQANLFPEERKEIERTRCSNKPRTKGE